MCRVATETVAETWEKIAGMSPEKTGKLLNHLEKQQPVLVDYLAKVGDGFLTPDEREFIAFLSFVIWQIFSRETKPIKTISEKVLDSVERMNRSLFEHLETVSEHRLMRVLAILLQNYNQREILHYLVQILMGTEDGTAFVQKSNRGIAIVTLKTVIDCFGRQFREDIK